MECILTTLGRTYRPSRLLPVRSVHPSRCSTTPDRPHASSSDRSAAPDGQLRAFGTWRCNSVAQLYQYQRQADGTLAWISTGVDAKLFNMDGSFAGTHTTGPQWTFGTTTHRGMKLNESNATNPTSVPWLLIRITNPSPDGNQLSYIQRVYTAAGLPPVGSRGVVEGDTYGAPYTAIYLFWGVTLPGPRY